MKNRHKLAIALGAGAMLLCGCAQELVQLRLSAGNLGSRIAISKCNSIYSDVRLEALSGHFPHYRQEPTIQMLTSERKPHATILPAIKALEEDFKKCAIEHRSVIATFKSAQHAAVYDSFVNSASILHERLYRSEISYGEFLRRWRNLASDMYAALDQMDNNLLNGYPQELVRVENEYVRLQRVLNEIDNQREPIVCYRVKEYVPCNM